ncbi:MAG: sulfatase [Planctomycetes bacterium]|nr:sulfatase [Planctomycetota bacterium]
MSTQDPIRARAEQCSRRDFLGRCGSLSLGGLALSTLLADDGVAQSVASDPLAPRVPHHPARARSVIYLHMAGSPPPHDTFDPKPELNARDGQLCPKHFIEGRRLAFIKGHPTLLGSPHGVVRAGESGLAMTELLPHLATVADELCVIRSMKTDEFNHAPAQLLLHTGSNLFGHASMGAWATYGLGTENSDLPGYVVMISGGTDPSGGKTLWSSGFLPSHFQATQIRGFGDPVFYLSNPRGMSRESRRRSLDALRKLNEIEEVRTGDPEVRSRINQYELAFRMQESVPEVMDIRREPAEVRELYGADPGKPSFANHCLLARRLVERGVRFVQLYDWGWDIHGTGKHDDLMTQFPMKCRQTDRPIAALLKDLRRRGLLDSTLVVWGGEFGRTSMNEKRNGSRFLGRDHHPDCFTIWMAGGGARAGSVFGETDPLGYTVHQDPVHVRDLQATILWQLGLDPHRRSYSYQGLRRRLIGPADWPRVRHELLA